MFRFKRVLYIASKPFSSISTMEKQAVNKMKAWQIHSYGDLSELQLSVARMPEIQKPTDVLVRVEAASLNPIDKMIIGNLYFFMSVCHYMIYVGGYGRELLGLLRAFKLEFPLTLGRDFAGVVVDKGHGVGEEINVGDSVYGALASHEQGSLAETVLCGKDMVTSCYVY